MMYRVLSTGAATVSFIDCYDSLGMLMDRCITALYIFRCDLGRRSALPVQARCGRRWFGPPTMQNVLEYEKAIERCRTLYSYHTITNIIHPLLVSASAGCSSERNRPC
jgi:hypothetical protein